MAEPARAPDARARADRESIEATASSWAVWFEGSAGARTQWQSRYARSWRATLDATCTRRLPA